MKAIDWTLLVISAAKGKFMSTTHIECCLYLLGKEFPEMVGRDFYEFPKSDIGLDPFDQNVYFDTDKLTEKELLFAQRPNLYWYEVIEYAVTVDGWEKANKLKACIPEEVTEYLIRKVKWARKVNYPALHNAIYKEYPECTEYYTVKKS